MARFALAVALTSAASPPRSKSSSASDKNSTGHDRTLSHIKFMSEAKFSDIHFTPADWQLSEQKAVYQRERSMNSTDA